MPPTDDNEGRQQRMTRRERTAATMAIAPGHRPLFLTLPIGSFRTPSPSRGRLITHASTAILHNTRRPYRETVHKGTPKMQNDVSMREYDMQAPPADLNSGYDGLELDGKRFFD